MQEPIQFHCRRKCHLRAVESERPADEWICYDPYAQRFVPGWLYYSMRFFIQSGYAEWRGPGVNGFLAARDRYIDDVLQNLLSKGLEQLILPQNGAGIWGVFKRLLWRNFSDLEALPVGVTS